MKYAVARALDQTIGFWSESAEDYGGEEGWTTKHPEAKLWGTQAEVDIWVNEYNDSLSWVDYEGKPITAEYRSRFFVWVEEVKDETEFRAREDTW